MASESEQEALAQIAADEQAATVQQAADEQAVQAAQQAVVSAEATQAADEQTEVATAAADLAAAQAADTVQPGPVPGLTGTAGNGQVTLTWSAPTVGSTPFTYDVSVSPLAGSTTIAGTTATVTGLSDGTTYTFGVSATNTAGAGTVEYVTETPTAPATTKTPDPGGYSLPYPSGPFAIPAPTELTPLPNSAALVGELTAGITSHYGDVAPDDDGNLGGPTRYVVNGFGQPVTPPVPVTIAGAGTVQVPIPEWAIPSPASDHEMIIVDLAAGYVWEFWLAAVSNGQWSARTCSQFNRETSTGTIVRGQPIAGQQTSVTTNTTAASGISLEATTIRALEVQEGSPTHAIAIALPNTAASDVAPADYSDGGTAGGIPEGTLFVLPATVPMPAGLNKQEEYVFKALQQFGAYVTDTAGATIVPCESGNAWVAAGLPDPWPTLRAPAQWEYEAFAQIAGIWAQLVAVAAPTVSTKTGTVEPAGEVDRRGYDPFAPHPA